MNKNRLSAVGSQVRQLPTKIAVLAKRRADRIIVGLILFYGIAFSVYTSFMYYAFKTYAWDLGIYTQSLWSTVNLGKPLFYTIETYFNPSQNFLGTHFSPILFLVVPLYAVFQSPITLLVLQSFVLGLAALPIYWIAREKLNGNLWGLTFAAAFLLSPAVHSINCFDFHVESFIPLFFALTFYYTDKKKYLLGIIFAFLTLSTIEFAPILVGALALYFMLKWLFQSPKGSIFTVVKRISVPLFLVVVSVLWFLIAFQIMYDINPLKSVGLPGNWDVWGRSMGEVVMNVLRNPVTAIGLMVNPIDKVYYVFSLLVPVLFLPFIAPFEFILVAPWLFAALLSEYPPYFQYYYQYGGLIIAQIFIAAIYGARKLITHENKFLRAFALPGLEKKFALAILLLSLISFLAISPVGLPALTSRSVVIDQHVQTLHEVLSMIPSNASVATQNDILPQLAQRAKIVILGWPRQDTVNDIDEDFIVVDTKSPLFHYGPSPNLISPNDALAAILTAKTKAYGAMACADGILLFQKNYSGPVMLKSYDDVFNYKNLLTNAARALIEFDPSSQSGQTIVYDENHFALEGDSNVWFGPYTYLYGGSADGWNYSATFRMKTRTENMTFIIDVYSEDSQNSLVSRQLTFNDFGALDEWHDFTLYFVVRGLQRWEFRGWAYTNSTYVALDYVRIQLVGS